MPWVTSLVLLVLLLVPVKMMTRTGEDDGLRP